MLGTGETGVVLKERGMDVPLETGETAYFNYFWLRDNCPSSFDQETRERAFDIFAESEAPCASSAAISGGVLKITWAGAGHVTRMPLSLLASYAKGEKRADVAKVSRTPWFADHYDHMAHFSYSQLTESETEICCWAKAMLTDGIALLTGLPDTDAALLDTASLIGHVRPSYFGQVFEVKTHIKPTNLAFTSKALPLHTDLPDEDLAPGIQFLHCRANTVEGGNSLFVDGLAVAEDFRLAHPEDFELLVATDVPYFCEHERFDMRSRQHVIELDEYGNVSGVTISQHHADMFDLPQQELDRFYPAFCRFGQMMRREKYLMQFRLNAGECIVFDNHRIVHGRAAYSASSGDRHLRGCYTDRGELRSTFRVLEGKKERTE